MAGRLAASGDVPVLVVTTHSFMLQRRAADSDLIDGPRRLSELDQFLAEFKSR
ncbi:MAG TPA: hypothetical protein VLM36_09275 [Sphingomicrobium sp.]|nr:hypothetical protein [Sphingomicrobium sp.]